MFHKCTFETYTYFMHFMYVTSKIVFSKSTRNSRGIVMECWGRIRNWRKYANNLRTPSRRLRVRGGRSAIPSILDAHRSAEGCQPAILNFHIFIFTLFGFGADIIFWKSDGGTLVCCGFKIRFVLILILNSLHFKLLIIKIFFFRVFFL